MRLIQLPDDHGGPTRTVVEIGGPDSRQQIADILGGPFETVASAALLDACGMRDVHDYRVIPVMLVRRFVDGLVHNTFASDAYSPESHVYGPVLLAGADQGAQDSSAIFQDPPEALFLKWVGPAGLSGQGGGAGGNGA